MLELGGVFTVAMAYKLLQEVYKQVANIGDAIADKHEWQ